MGTHSEGIKEMERKWLGKRVNFDNKIYTVVEIDANYGLVIDRPAQCTKTTCIADWMVGMSEAEARQKALNH